jgi:hypothetical protein
LDVFSELAAADATSVAIDGGGGAVAASSAAEAAAAAAAAAAKVSLADFELLTVRCPQYPVRGTCLLLKNK